MFGSVRGFAVRVVAAVVFPLLFGWVVPALAYEPPAGTVVYGIEHSKYGDIGTHSLTFSHDGADLIVAVNVRIRVKVLFITAHSVTANRRETWRAGRLVAYRSNTVENNRPTEVTAREEAGKLVIEGPEGKAEAAGPVFPTNPWNPEIVNAKLLMETGTGELLHVLVRPAGEEELAVAGRSVKARKYLISGDMARELWFDAAGNLLQFRFQRDGAMLTFKRRTPLP